MDKYNFRPLRPISPLLEWASSCRGLQMGERGYLRPPTMRLSNTCRSLEKCLWTMKIHPLQVWEEVAMGRSHQGVWIVCARTFNVPPSPHVWPAAWSYLHWSWPQTSWGGLCWANSNCKMTPGSHGLCLVTALKLPLCFSTAGALATCAFLGLRFCLRPPLPCLWQSTCLCLNPLLGKVRGKSTVVLLIGSIHWNMFGPEDEFCSLTSQWGVQWTKSFSNCCI